MSIRIRTMRFRDTHDLTPRGFQWLAIFAMASLAGCGSQLETQSRADLQRVHAQLQSEQAGDSETELQSDRKLESLGTLRTYVASAFANSPELRASYEEWRAALQGPAQARRFPELVLTYGGFIRAVETRVGPQLHRVGAMQWFPWPTRLNAGRDAAAHAAVSAQQRFEALALEVAAEVARAYWKLWFIQKNQVVQRAQRDVLLSLSEQARARLEAGRSGLSDLAQVDLSISKVSDVMAGLQEAERSATAELVRVIGAEPGTPTPIQPEEDPPLALLPGAEDSELRDAAVAHPRVEAMASMSEAANERARAAKGERGPSIGLGLEWIVTGTAVPPSIANSGQDAVIGLVGLKIPVSGGAYKAAKEQALAEGAMYRARERAARDRAVAELAQALANLRDAVRRVQLYETTLVPQAETTYSSTLDGYQSGRASLAEVLIAERDLLELALGLFQAHASYGVSWAELERVVGHPVVTQPDEDDFAP
ncbi:MAG: TolC family protein [Polyangiales bacterium]|jgi:outer membrane protein TolC